MLRTYTVNTPSKIEFTPDHPNFKTRICRHFLKGFCNRGDKCNFAHGYHQVKRNVKKPLPNMPGKTLHTVESGSTVEYNTMYSLIDDYVILSKDAQEKI